MYCTGAGLLDDEELDRDALRLSTNSTRSRVRRFPPTAEDEDVHTALERGLLERAGAELGGKLRAGRSRNDQVATLFRMWLAGRGAPGRQRHAATSSTRSSNRHGTPGRACRAGRTYSTPSPYLLAHHLLAHAQALVRDVDRLRDWDARAAVSPLRLGCAGRFLARAGPEAVAAELGFTEPVDNSIDGTASRDFAAEACFVFAMLGVNLSRIAEEVIIWATAEFGYVTLDDACSTGSSIMPQKKNPDVAELGPG